MEARWDHRLLHERWGTGRPKDGSRLEVRKLPVRRHREHPNTFWGIGIRLGSQACNEATDYLAPIKNRASATRGTSIRELMGFLQPRSQIGCPPTLHADASPGFPRMAYRSAEIAMAKCDAGEFVLARIEDPVAEGHNAPETELTQRAEVGRTLPRRQCANSTNLVG